jgi:hypothetical protein
MMEACYFVPLLAMAAKSRQEINPLVDSAHGDKTLSIILGNRITEAIKYKKTSKNDKMEYQHHGSCWGSFRKTRGKAVNAGHIRKALAQSLACSRTGFCLGMTHQVHNTTTV